MTDTTSEQTLDAFIAQHGLTMDAEPAWQNPDADWPAGSIHWLCIIRRAGHRIDVPFSQGSAHTEAPTLADVLDCLASDASMLDNAKDAWELAEESGDPIDGREKFESYERTYYAIQRNTDALAALIGVQALEALKYNTERL